MSRVDARGCAISGATPTALQAYERALAASLTWRCGADAQIARALEDEPGFVMAHVMQAWLLVCSRDPQRVRSAVPALARAARLPANERERLHLSALAAALGDDFDRAKALLGQLLRQHPRDALALQVAHAFDYVTGDAAAMKRQVTAVLPAWTRELPGHDAVLAMHAFALEECGEYERAEDVAREALALDPADARAHHAMAHVFEMSGRAEAGVRWLSEHVDGWSVDTVVATHGWWHMALFHLSLEQTDRALALYDRRVRGAPSAELADLIDAAALLWRIRLAGGDGGDRWVELAAAWASRIADAYCSFSDLHAMLAFVGVGDRKRAKQLERALLQRQVRPTRYGRTTRQLGLPSCRALLAFGHGDDTLAVTLLASLPALAHRLGGSQAQRDVLNLTLLQAIERARASSGGARDELLETGAALACPYH